MRSQASLFAAALLLALPSDPGAAQAAAAPPAPGARIRVHTRYIYIGTLLSLDTSALVLRRDALRDTLRLPLATIGRLDVSTGKKSGAGRGAKLGLIVGAGVGAAVGLAAAEDCSSQDFVCFGPEVIPAMAIVVGAMGAGLGALIGAASPIDRWEQVRVRPVGVGVAPLPRGHVGIGASIAF